MSLWQRFFRETRAEIVPTLLGFFITWLFVTCWFFMNLQFARLAYRRDVVDHMAFVAGDVARKTYCAGGQSLQAARDAASGAIEALRSTSVGAGDSCKLHVQTSDDTAGAELVNAAANPAAASLDVMVECTFVCSVPVAAQVLCKRGRTMIEARRNVTALGCDGAARP